MDPLHIIKIGGNIIDDPTALETFLKTFSAIPGHKILVHGGGKLATDLAFRLGIPQTLIDGRRVTDDETLNVAVMVYAGLVNKTIVATLQAHSCNAIGFCGVDGNLMKATKREYSQVDFGWVGDIIPANVNTKMLEQLLSADLVPVIAPITHDGKGHLLNTNADTMTSVIASAMSGKYKVRLTYCFEKDGVLRDVDDEHSIIPVLKKEEYLKLKDEGIISKGMIPKLDNAFDALDTGIEEVHICNAKESPDYGFKRSWHQSGYIMKALQEEAITLLQKLISIESFSKTEDKTADAIEAFLKEKGIPTHRHLNNVWAINKHFDDTRKTLLLNSHHDTVKPNSHYTRDPFAPVIENGKLYGLGSNDAGGPLVSLLACFVHFYDRTDLHFNLIFAATAEEEISGVNGVESILPNLGTIHCGIVGEPTRMEIAIAEKGLLVIDCVTQGVPGHAARDEGENAIYLAMKDIEWFRMFAFPKVSATLGPVKMTVSMIQAGIQHNIVPGTCSFTVDIRTTDEYSNAEALHVIEKNVTCSVKARSLRLNASSIPKDHPLVMAGEELDIRMYGSPTTSDQAVMNFPTIKMGPGDSARSHTADEFIYVSEIEEGIHTYINLLNKFNTL